MREKTSEEKIKELKAIRAELMAIKEYSESDEGEGNNSDRNTNIVSIRREYLDDSSKSTEKNSSPIEDARSDLYAQYEDTEEYESKNSEGKSMTLNRRR